MLYVTISCLKSICRLQEWLLAGYMRAAVSCSYTTYEEEAVEPPSPVQFVW